MPRATPLDPDARRAAIMVATEPLLARYGATVSTRQIAEAAGVAEGTIFRVFPTKDALFDAVVEDAFALDQVCADLGGIDLTLPLESRLLQAADILHARLVRVVALFHTLVARQDRPQSFRDLRERRETERERVQAAVAALLAPDADRLLTSPEATGTMLNALLMSAAHPMFAGADRPSPADIVAVLLHGILRPSPDSTSAASTARAGKDPAC